jgi:hypothetical protein
VDWVAEGLAEKVQKMEHGVLFPVLTVSIIMAEAAVEEEDMKGFWVGEVLVW